MTLHVSLTGNCIVSMHTGHYTVHVVCRQLIYNYPEQLFADAGVMAIEHADFEGIERLALVLGKLYSYPLFLCVWL